MIIEPTNQAVQTPPGADIHPLEADEEAAIEALRSRVYSRQDTWVQELLANARDAVRERRKVEPTAEAGIRIRIDHDSSRILVQDDGLGMSRRLLMDVFRILGRSTRRDSDQYTGAWGIGSKSPLKICDSFTLSTRSRADGAAHRLLVGRLEHEGTVRWGFSFVGSEPCSDSWGTTVEVIVPPNLLAACTERARQTCRYWADRVELTVVKDGNTTVSHLGGEDAIQGFVHAETDEAYACLVEGDYHHSGGLLMLVDDIPYETRTVFFSEQLRIRLKRPGAVDLTTGRELLDQTPKTNGVVARAASALQQACLEKLAPLLDSLASLPAAERRAAVTEAGKFVKAHEVLTTLGGQGTPLGPGVHPLLASAETWTIRHDGGATGQRRFALRQLYRLLDGTPLFYGLRIPTKTLQERLPPRPSDVRPRAYIVACSDEPSPTQEVLRMAGAMYLSLTRPREPFRACVWRSGDGTRTTTDVAAIPKDRPVVVAAKVADLWGLPAHATYLIAPSRRALALLRAHGHRIVNVDSFVSRLAKKRLQTSSGRRPLGSLTESVTWIHGLPDSLVAQLRAPEGEVAGGDDEDRCFWHRLHSKGRWSPQHPLHTQDGRKLEEALDAVQPGLSWIVKDVQKMGAAKQRQVAALVERLATRRSRKVVKA